MAASGESRRGETDRDRQVRGVILIEGCANLAVLGMKLVVGLTTGSMAVLGDAVHSLTDVSNNVVAWVVIRLSSRPADADHPYGHRKFETLAVFGLAMLLTVLAFELAAGAIRRTDPVVVHSGWGLVVMLCVLSVNIILASWQGMRARQLDSDILRADSRHTFADVLTTVVVIAGWQAAAIGYGWFDTVAAILVSLMILTLAYGLFRRSIPVLVDQASIEPDMLRGIVMAVPGAVSVRSVRSRGYGAKAAVDLVVTVAPELSTVESHDIATAVERTVRRHFPVESITVHIEPQTAPPR